VEKKVLENLRRLHDGRIRKQVADAQIQIRITTGFVVRPSSAQHEDELQFLLLIIIAM